MGLVPRMDRLNHWIEVEISVLQERIQSLPQEAPGGWEDLNRLFQQALEAA